MWRDWSGSCTGLALGGLLWHFVACCGTWWSCIMLIALCMLHEGLQDHVIREELTPAAGKFMWCCLSDLPAP